MSLSVCALLMLAGPELSPFQNASQSYPRCDTWSSLSITKRRIYPPQFLGNKSNVRIDFDDMDDKYYRDVGYYDSSYESSKESLDRHKETSNGSNDSTLYPVFDDMVWKESGEDGIINEQVSCPLPNPPEATQALVDFNLSGKNFSIGENSHNAFGSSQNEESRILYAEVHSTAIADMNTELSFDIQATNNLGMDRQMGTMNLGNEESTITSSNQPILSSCTHDGNTQHAVLYAQGSENPHDTPKKGNRRKKEITHKEIQSLRDEHMTLIEAAQKLGVSRSTMKRRCKELRLDEWPSSRKKRSTCTKNRKTNTKLPSGGERSKPSQPNLVECTNQAGLAYANESLVVNPHNLSGQVAPHCDSIDNSAHKATTGSVGELNVASDRHMDNHESVHECMDVADVLPLLSNVQDSSSSRSLKIKATYKEDIVKFKFSSTVCLKELKGAVATNLKIEFDSFKLKYLDEEEDWVLINTNEHLESALSFVKNNILRLRVINL